MKSTKPLSLSTLCLLVALAGLPLQAQQAERPESPEGPQVLLGEVHRLATPNQGAWLGVELADVTQANMKELKLPGDYGAIVKHVAEDSPAAKAGLKENDVILDFGGMRVWSAAQLQQFVDETPPGREVTLRISRSGQKLNLQATMGSPRMHAMTLPPFRIPHINVPRQLFYGFGPFETRGRLGIEAEDLTPQLASYFGVKQGKGVLVTEVEQGSPAAKAGLKAGDCIVRVDSTEVDSISGLRGTLREKGEGSRAVALTVVRNGHEETLHATLRASGAPNLEQQAENFTESLERQVHELELERQVQELEKEIPRFQREEKQLESCLMALETHLFQPQSVAPGNTAVIHRRDGSWFTTGPGCPLSSSEQEHPKYTATR
ncbi:MAG TPA: PDZ domain-containing protein [Terriglobia bacterium]|nr:PDZ domain-containing protein [Terriglobia bacterium]